MAPFKLKFRMGSSRSTSQEVDPDPQVNEALLNHSTTIGASNSTIDSADCTSLGSIGNEKRSLLPNKTNNLRLGYLNPTATQCTSENSVPKSPPPSYEHVLEENTRLANNLDLDGSRLTLSTEDGVGTGDQTTNSNLSSINNIRNPSNNSSENLSYEHITNTCTDPDCLITNESQNSNCRTDNNDDNENNRKKSIDSTEYLISTMTTPSSQENLLEDECDGDGRNCGVSGDNHNNRMDNNSDYDSHRCHHHHDNEDDNSHQAGTPNQPPPEYTSHNENQQSDDNESDDDWDSNQQSQMSSNTYQQEEIISNKSSKEIYKAISKQWGITCKMSDQCRCMECQSNYFDCEYDDNEHQKTDGGLGAGTPMFISEVMQGSACTIL